MSSHTEMMHQKRLQATSSGETPYNDMTVVPNRGRKICLSSCCLLFGLVAVAVGIALPIVVSNMVKTGVEDLVRLDPSTFTKTTAENFYNASTGEDFYVFNLTNLYAVLTTGASPNFAEVGPIKTYRYPNRYNVTWDTENSRVSFDWLSTFEVLPESRHLLDQPIIGPNLFYLGLGAQVMRQYVAAQRGQDPTSAHWTPDARFAGNYLNEKLAVTGFFGGQIFPSVIKTVFRNVAASKFLTSIRSSGLVFYTQLFKGYCQKVCAATGRSQAGILHQWALAAADPSQALSGTYSAAPANQLQNPYFLGFELDKPLNTSNPDTVAANIFNPSNPYSVASSAGLTQWGLMGAGMVSPVTVALGLGIDPASISQDIPTIAAWISKFSKSVPSTPIGRAFELSICAAFNNVIQTYVTAGAGISPFSQLYADVASYNPTSYDDIGAMQFGSGFVVGLIKANSTLFVDGVGSPTSSLSATVDPAAPFNFNDGATEPEPMEFTAGIKYYVDHNKALDPTVTAGWPTGADQSGLWLVNRALLYFNGSNAFHQLNIAQTNTMFNVILESSSNFGGLISALQPIVQTYAFVFQSNFVRTNPATYGPAVVAATTAAMGRYTVQTTTATLLARADVQSFVTRSNWYAVWSYLYNYVGQELSGSLAQLDPTTGLTPQNNGLFTKMTVSQMLFGEYKHRIPNVVIPPIGGPQLGSKPYQQLLNEDIVVHQGRRWAQDTGHANIHTVGQWIQYEGTPKYSFACDLNDPARTVPGVCAPPNSTTEAANNWRAWGSDAVIAGSGSSQQIPPFMENNDDFPRSSVFYVTELKRAVQANYKYDVENQGIRLRRYGLDESLVQANLTSPNPEKNDEKWFQQNVPTGLFSLQTVKGGVPAVSSVPHFGLTLPGTINQGVTCDGMPCTGGNYYVPELHDTYLDIEPLTGLTMNGAKRLQANFRVSAQEFWTGSAYTDTVAGGAGQGYPAKYPQGFNVSTQYPALQAPGGFNYHYNNLFKNGRETIYIPYYWASIYDTISAEDAKTFRDKKHTIKVARDAAQGMRYAGIIGGGLIALISAFYLFTICAPTLTSHIFH